MDFETRIQNVSGRIGVNFDDLKNFLMKFVPVIREAIIVILEQIGWLPVSTQQQAVPASEDRKVYQDSGLAQVSGMYGLDESFLRNLFERIGPILAGIIMELLRNLQPAVAKQP